MAKTLFINDLVNPSVGSALSLKAIISDYKNRYAKSYINTTKIHCVRDKDRYVVHGIIPSEENHKYLMPIFYDVVIEFYPPDKQTEMEMTIRNYAVKVFSNSPSWMFTMTYLFAKNRSIPRFVPREYYSEAALKEPAKEKNPMNLFGIEKSVFMVLYHLELVTGFRKNRLSLIELYKTTPDDLLKKIMGQVEKLDEINFEKKKTAMRRKRDKQKAQSLSKAAQREATFKHKKKSQESLYSDLTNKRFTSTISNTIIKDTAKDLKNLPQTEPGRTKVEKKVELKKTLATSLSSKTIKKKK